MWGGRGPGEEEEGKEGRIGETEEAVSFSSFGAGVGAPGIADTCVGSGSAALSKGVLGTKKERSTRWRLHSGLVVSRPVLLGMLFVEGHLEFRRSYRL